ncbi:hypothetical protein E4K02_19275 (plasmid) [Acinetobacter baumannii]|uniref:Uncharacterized protein n=1 Tax=Acinetobacter baumannii TaxID=470 RepID=A0A3R9SCF6_ACIBA|nr:hypothetical protein E4K02_19275 [Acinetobacter baumannii]RSP71439.1 hypothetical protein EA722_16240 [Acinetobacter baumannii]
MKDHKKKPVQGCSGYKIETTALISIDNYNAFRIRCIMLILGKFKNLYAMVYSIFFDFLSFRLIRNSQ